MSERRRLTSYLGVTLALALARPARAQENGRFLDSEQTPRDFDREYAAWIDNRQPNYLRALAETTAALGLGTLYYLFDPLYAEPDSDQPSLGEKLTFQAVSFDDNMTSTNFILHPLAGALIYDLGRVNGLPFYTAFAYGAASSFLFEFFLEYRDKASVNDLIITPFGGMALGEFWFHLGNYVTSAPGGGGFGNHLAAYTLGWPQKLHDGLDNRSLPRTGLPADSLGFSQAYWHRFRLGYGFGAETNDESDAAPVHALELSAALVAVPGFLRPGRIIRGFDQGNFTRGRLRFLLNADGLEEVDASVSALLFGHFAQDMSAQEGVVQAIGLGTGLRYFDSWRLDRRDGYAFVYLLDPMLLVWARTGKLRFEGRAEVSLDFGGVRPLAYAEWSEQFGTEGLKSVLIRRGYVFAGCASARLELAGSSYPFGLGTEGNLAYCRSIQGLDRKQDEVTNDVPTGDLIGELASWLALRPSHAVEVRAELETRIRNGSMKPVADDAWDLRAGGALVYEF